MPPCHSPMGSNVLRGWNENCQRTFGFFLREIKRHQIRDDDRITSKFDRVFQCSQRITKVKKNSAQRHDVEGPDIVRYVVRGPMHELGVGAKMLMRVPESVVQSRDSE